MAEITKKDALHVWIDSKTALFNLRLESPGAYNAVMRLREEYPTLMKLPAERIIPLMKRAVNGLIKDGQCKKRVTPGELEELWKAQEERKKRFREEKKSSKQNEI